ncbi:ArsR family transcriptional regulator [Campylobacter ureolyticus]|uniref:Firmicute plasmid replication protein (RepL) n=1 Tax=Campylobacter ureolyticus TaxID=827 RepID=A0A6N2S5Y5_9BACT
MSNINSLEIYKKILGDKKVSVIEFLAKNYDKNGFITLSVNEICTLTNTSKPTVIQTLKLLDEKFVLKKIKNGVYKLNL